LPVDETMSRSHNSPAANELLVSLSCALRCIENAAFISDARAHDARKYLKRARAALRLLRANLGDATYHRENRALRDASRAISSLRDAKAQVDTLETLTRGHPQALSFSEIFPLEVQLRTGLGQMRARARRDAPQV